MDQKLVLNCVLCFLVGFFFHKIMGSMCGNVVEGQEAPKASGETHISLGAPLPGIEHETRVPQGLPTVQPMHLRK